MEMNLDLFVPIAEIAGIFVGFGALISVGRDRGAETLAMLRTVITNGLVVLVAALIPVALSRYGLTDRTLWGCSSAAFLVMTWIAILGQLQDSKSRAWAMAYAKTHPKLTTFFWVFFEVPIQVPLVLAMVGFAPSLAPAFYLTALVVNLFEAAFLLARVVFTRSLSDVP